MMTCSCTSWAGETYQYQKSWSASLLKEWWEMQMIFLTGFTKNERNKRWLRFGKVITWPFLLPLILETLYNILFYCTVNVNMKERNKSLLQEVQDNRGEHRIKVSQKTQREGQDKTRRRKRLRKAERGEEGQMFTDRLIFPFIALCDLFLNIQSEQQQTPGQKCKIIFKQV